MQENDIFDGDRHAKFPHETQRDEWFVLSSDKVVELPHIQTEEEYNRLPRELQELIDSVDPEEIWAKIAEIDPFFR